MRLKIAIFSLLCFMTAGLMQPSYSAEEKTISVAGFLNKGARSDDSVNLVISKSLISVLQKVPGFKVTPFSRVESEAKKRDLWTVKNYELNNLLDFGLLFAAKTIVCGDYLIDKGKETVQINVFAYNVATGELTMKRTYKGSAGVDIFDTIDNMVKNITSLLAGRAVVFAKLDLNIVNTKQVYHLYISSNFQKAVSSADPFSENVLANEPLLVTLQKPDNANEVFRKSLLLKEGEVQKISYEPSGTVVVRFKGGAGSAVFLDGKKVGVIDNAGECLISGINLADGQHKIHVVRKEDSNNVKSFNLEEGKTAVVDFSGGNKWFGASVYALTGGLGGSAGIDLYPMDFLRISPHGGVVFIANTLVPIAELDVACRFLEFGNLGLWANAGVSFYFVTGPVVISPMLKLEVSWWLFFANCGARYSLYDGNFYPALNAGVRFVF